MNRRQIALLLTAVLASTVLVGTGTAEARPGGAGRPAVALSVDPGALGPDAIDELAYDLGNQAFQPQGFPARVELKAKVYAPHTISGRVPIVIVQHGRHGTCANATQQLLVWPCPASVPEIPSYRGYDALGRNLASHGMIVVSIGANGINANDGFLEDGGAAARAQLILEHLRRWKAWDASATGSPFGGRFVGHVALDRVGLVGHSRGGEGIAAAIQLNQRSGAPFGIEAAVALAPVDFDRRIIGGVDLGIILPYCDGDVSDLQGASYYDDGRYASPGDTSSKSTYLLYGANHNFFNTVWTSGPGSFDDAGFFEIEGAPAATSGALGASTDPCQPGGPGRLSAAQQEQAGATLMAGYLRRYLGPEPDLAPLVTGAAPFPASVGPARWAVAHHAGDRLDVATWSTESASRRNERNGLSQRVGVTPGTICNAKGSSEFGTASPPGTVTKPCETDEGLAMTNDTGVLDVGWVQLHPVVREPLGPGSTDVTAYDGLRLRVAVPIDSRNTARAKQDFTVVLEDADGSRASVVASTGTNGLQRLNPGYVQHSLLNGVRIPLTAFTSVDLSRLRAVELRFDRTGAGRLELSDLAFTQEGTGSAAANTVGVGALTPSLPTCRTTAANRWACAIVQTSFGRDPTERELATYAPSYATVTRRRQAIARIVSDPTTRQVVMEQYAQAYTQAEVDPVWVRSMLSLAGQRSWTTGRVDLTQGFAYSSPLLSSPGQIVDATYESLLGRPADAAGRAYWAPRVEANGPAKLAGTLVATAGHRGRLVDARYLQILGRPADAAGRAYWVTKLASPEGEQALVASLLGTESFRSWAVH